MSRHGFLLALRCVALIVSIRLYPISPTWYAPSDELARGKLNLSCKSLGWSLLLCWHDAYQLYTVSAWDVAWCRDLEPKDGKLDIDGRLSPTSGSADDGEVHLLTGGRLPAGGWCQAPLQRSARRATMHSVAFCRQPVHRAHKRAANAYRMNSEMLCCLGAVAVVARSALQCVVGKHHVQ